MPRAHSLAAAAALTFLGLACRADSPQLLEPGSEAPHNPGRPSLAVERLRVQTKGTSARAGFSTTDPTGCVQTSVFVAGAEGSVKAEPGAPTPTGAAAFLDLEQFDFCTGTGLVVFGDFTEGVSFEANSTLTRARLQGTLHGRDDITGEAVDVTVDLTWTGTGKLIRQSSRERFQLPGILVFQSSRHVLREATASGAVSVGGVNFTPDPSEFASIGGDTELEIDHTSS